MIKKLINAIKEYNTIIIHRHNRPDLDALGSQVGLALSIKETFPSKEVYVVGDMSQRYAFLQEMDNISDEKYNGALAIICDVAVAALVSDDRYKLAKEVFVIDHHTNPSDITENTIIDSSRIAASELITIILSDNGFNIPKNAATALFGGIVTDSGRFQYNVGDPKPFLTAAQLIELGADMSYIYDNIYIEDLDSRQMKNYFSNNIRVNEYGVAYLINEQDDLDKFPKADVFGISRGMVSLMSGIKEILIWCNFTFDKTRNVYLGEFRSRNIKIVDIAKKYGGGGHDLACGASLANKETIELVIKDFSRLTEEKN